MDPNSPKKFPADEKVGSAENKNSKDELSKKKKKKKKSKKKTSSTARTSFLANPFNLCRLLNDPSIKKLAEQIAKYQSENQMVEQGQKTSLGATQDGLPKLDDKIFNSTMRHVMENPTFMTMAEHLGNALMQDPSMSSMLASFTNPSNEGQLQERKARIYEEPYFKQILDEIENGGPDVIMRYLNDEEVLKKLGQALGILPNCGVAAAASEISGPDETEDVGNEDESIVHHTANVGDVQVKHAQFLLECVAEVDSLDKNKNTTLRHASAIRIPSLMASSSPKDFPAESIKKELSLVILKLHLVDLLFRPWPRTPLPYYWYGYQRALTGHSRVKSGHSRAKSCHSRAKSSTLTNNPRDQETQVAGSEALLAILARVKEDKPHVRFTKELVLVLFLYHSLCNLGCTLNQIDEEEAVARGKAILASARELEAELFGNMQTVEGSVRSRVSE